MMSYMYVRSKLSPLHVLMVFLQETYRTEKLSRNVSTDSKYVSSIHITLNPTYIFPI